MGFYNIHFHYITFDLHIICSYQFFLLAFLILKFSSWYQSEVYNSVSISQQESESACQESTLPSMRRPVIETFSSTQEIREETKSKIDHIQIKINKLIQTTKKLYQIKKS
jgi:hypothetical protein